MRNAYLQQVQSEAVPQRQRRSVCSNSSKEWNPHSVKLILGETIPTGVGPRGKYWLCHSMYGKHNKLLYARAWLVPRQPSICKVQRATEKILPKLSTEEDHVLSVRTLSLLIIRKTRANLRALSDG